MKKAATISKSDNTSEVTDYSTLRTTALDTVQEYAHDHWTDFNEHDPGVTIMEQFCYALTDLGYRTGFSMKDLLAAKTTKLTEKRYHNSFFSAKEIMVCSAVTINDYRKLLINCFDNVQNAWVTQQTSDSINIKGFYNICIEPDDELALDADGQKTLVEQARTLLLANRNLCEDFASIEVLQPTRIGLSASITLREGANPFAVLARIFYLTQNYFSPPVGFYSYSALIEEGYTTDEIFTGPLLANGFIKDEDLQDKITRVDVNDLLKSVLDLPEIELVQNFKFISPDTGKEVESIELESSNFPQLITNISGDDPRSQITLVIKGVETTITNQEDLDHELKMLRSATPNSTRHQKTDGPDIPIGEYRSLDDYDSIQNGFPPNYGIGPAGPPPNANTGRKAQAKQLKGYLLFYDQMMANYLAQLNDAYKLFSFDTRGPYDSFPEPTYFVKDLYDIPNIGPMLGGYQSFYFENDNFVNGTKPLPQWQIFKEDQHNEYHLGLRNIVEHTISDLDRKNRFLDHLLARFGESGSTLDLPGFEDFVGKDFKTIFRKGDFLRNYVGISRDRGRSFDYSIPLNNGEAINNHPGLSERISHMCGIGGVVNYIIRLTIDLKSTSGKINVRFLDDDNHIAFQFAIDTSIAAKDLSPYLYELIEALIEFGNQKEDILNQLVNYGQAAASKDGEKVYINLDNKKMISLMVPGNLPQDELVIIAQRVLDELGFLIINQNGFYIIEHLLLAPQPTDKVYKFSIEIGGNTITSSAIYNLNDLESVVKTINEDPSSFKVSKAQSKENKWTVSLQQKGQTIASSSPIAEEKEATDVADQLQLFLENTDQTSTKPTIECLVELEAGGDSIVLNLDFFSMQYTAVLPNWTPLFRNPQFRDYLEFQIKESSPAHLYPHFLWLTREEMSIFQDLYKAWYKLLLQRAGCDEGFIKFLNTQINANV